MNTSDIAEICHEANRTYCKLIGDPVQGPWEGAPAWQQSSCINGVKNVKENPGATPEGSHISWLKEKVDTGWKYGVVKDAEKKEHPCMVPYEELPEAQQKKDSLFTAIVKALL